MLCSALLIQKQVCVVFFVLFCFVCFVLVFWIWIFRDRISLCSPGCPGTHSLDQAGLELRNLPASVSQSAGITGCTTTAQLSLWF